MATRDPRAAIQPHKALCVMLCALITACAPMAATDERAQRNAYHRLSTFVSSGPERKPKADPVKSPEAKSAHTTSVIVPPPGPLAAKRENTSDNNADNTTVVAAASSLPTHAKPAPTYKAPTNNVPTYNPPTNNVPTYNAGVTNTGVQTPTKPETKERKSKGLFGFVSNLFGGKQSKDTADAAMLTAADSPRPLASATPQRDAQGSQTNLASLYGNESGNTSSGIDVNIVPAAEDQGTVVKAPTAVEPKPKRKSLFGGFFTGVKNKLNGESKASSSEVENAASPQQTTLAGVPPTQIPAATEVADTSAPTQNATAPGGALPFAAFSAANPIYITALDLSINNLNKRVQEGNFPLDERQLAFLTKGALDEDTAYQFLTESQLENYRSAPTNTVEAEKGKSLFDAMRDFLPRKDKKAQDVATEPKTMTLLTKIVVVSAQDSGNQRAIIMMKLKDNQTGIHLTDSRRTIELSPIQAQSTLAVKRAIGAELPAMLEGLAKDAYASLTAPEKPLRAQPTPEELKKKRAKSG